MIKACKITSQVANGPNKELKEKRISMEESRMRSRSNEAEISKKISKYRNRNSDKTPVAVKFTGVALLISIIVGILKYKIKK